MTKKHRIFLDKLVRDHQEGLMRQEGTDFDIYPMEISEYKEALLKKIVEEAHEVASSTSQEELMEELGDLLEVIYAVVKANTFTIEEVEKKRLEKKNLRGGFEKRHYLKWVEITNDSPSMLYYQKYLKHDSSSKE